jgi:hypothetical protein
MGALEMTTNPYTVPPGLMGEIAQFIYSAAPRPVPEIALAGAIGLMAGICGRAFNVSGTGLNLYVMLLAPTGTGKEGCASGIDKIMNAIRSEVPSSEKFIGPASIASGPALLKYIANTSQCFVSVIGEVGLLLQQLASPRAPAHQIELKKVILDLYMKSGAGSVLRPSIYSEREKSTSAVSSPAVTLLGESTPESFYGGLNEQAVKDGLLPRFLLIEYDGPAVPLNKMQAEPSRQLLEGVKALAAHAYRIMHQGGVINVVPDEAASKILDEFERECLERRNAGDATEVTRHLWNRAHMKVLRLSALVAVGVGIHGPDNAFIVITPEHTKWAIRIEEANVRKLLSRFENGEVGDQTDDGARVNKLRELINKYFERPASEFVGSLEGLKEMREKGAVPERYLFQRTANLSAFKNARHGSKLALKNAIEQLINFGEIVRVSNKEIPQLTNSHAALYMLAEESTVANGKLKAKASQQRAFKQLFDGAPPGEDV